MDGGTSGAYDIGDIFDVAGDFDEGFNDLDLYLLPQGATSIDEAIARSVSSTNLEHVFFQIPTTGMYEFWVYEFDNPLFSAGTDYAVAWWAFIDPSTGIVSGDYNGDELVDQQDYIVWRSNFGMTITPGAGADGNGDGMIDAADYTVWRDNLGTMTASLPSSAVPEPTTIVFCLFTVVVVAGAHGRLKSRGC
jgi:hypothetical protein